MGTLDRVVISKRWTGLGDCLGSLLAAWWYARATRRTLVADWRFSAYAPDPRTNVFASVFEPDRVLAGVPFLGDDSVNDLALSGPFHPPTWNADTVHRPWARREQESGAEREQAATLIARGEDVSAPVVVFDGSLNGAAGSERDWRVVLSDLRPRAVISGAVADFAAAHFAGQPVVAVHARRGNGGFLGNHAAYWSDVPAALGRIVTATREATRALATATGTEPAVLLCTDNGPVEGALRSALPQAFVRPKAFPPQGTGDLHLGVEAPASLMDAAVEMLLLAHADVLVRFPPESLFSLWGATMKRPSPLPVRTPVPPDFRPAVC